MVGITRSKVIHFIHCISGNCYYWQVKCHCIFENWPPSLPWRPQQTRRPAEWRRPWFPGLPILSGGRWLGSNQESTRIHGGIDCHQSKMGIQKTMVWRLCKHGRSSQHCYLSVLRIWPTQIGMRYHLPRMRIWTDHNNGLPILFTCQQTTAEYGPTEYLVKQPKIFIAFSSAFS